MNDSDDREVVVSEEWRIFVTAAAGQPVDEVLALADRHGFQVEPDVATAIAAGEVPPPPA